MITVVRRLTVGPSRFVTTGGTVRFSQYAEGMHTRMDLIDGATGEPISMVSVNLPDSPPPDRFHMWTRGWSENLGLPRACEKAGIFELLPEFHHIEGTNVMAQLAKLSPAAIEQFNIEVHQ